MSGKHGIGVPFLGSDLLEDKTQEIVEDWIVIR